VVAAAPVSAAGGAAFKHPVTVMRSADAPRLCCGGGVCVCCCGGGVCVCCGGGACAITAMVAAPTIAPHVPAQIDLLIIPPIPHSGLQPSDRCESGSERQNRS